MPPIGLWAIGDNGPSKLLGSDVELEKQLEEWIERDSDLLEAGLVVVGRQIMLEAGPLDLLAIDPQGRWVVIEIKRGAVRRDTIAQVLDYASCVASMPYQDLAGKINSYLATLQADLSAHSKALLLHRPATWTPTRRLASSLS